MNPRSLTFRLVTWYCALLLIVGGSYGVYSYAGFTGYLRDMMRDTLAVRARDAADVARAAPGGCGQADGGHAQPISARSQ